MIYIYDENRSVKMDLWGYMSIRKVIWDDIYDENMSVRKDLWG